MREPADQATVTEHLPEASESGAITNSLGARLAGAVAALLSVQVVSWLLNTGVNLIVPRYLGPVGMGKFAFADSVVEVALLLCGLSNTMLAVKIIARSPQTMSAWLSNALLVRLALASAGLGLAPFVLTRLGYADETIWLVLLIGIGIGLTNVNELLSGAFQGLQWMGRMARLSIVLRVLTAAGSLLLVAVGAPLIAFAVIGIPLGLIGVGVQLVPLWRYGFRFGGFSLAVVRRIIRESLPFLMVGLVAVPYTKLNVMLLGHFADEQAIGWYSVPLRLLGTSLFIPTILLTAAYPMLAQLYATDPGAALVQVRRMLVLVLGCAAAPALVLGAFGTPIMVLLYGDAYAPAGPVLQVFGLVLVAVYLNTFIFRVLSVMDREAIWTPVMAGALILAVPINAGLIQWMGSFGQASVGAAWGFFISELAMTVPGFIILARLQMGRVCLTTLGKGGLATLAAAACLLALMPWAPVLGLLLAAVAYAAVAWYIRLLPHADVIQAWQLGRQVIEHGWSRRPAFLRQRLIRWS